MSNIAVLMSYPGKAIKRVPFDNGEWFEGCIHNGLLIFINPAGIKCEDDGVSVLKIPVKAY